MKQFEGTSLVMLVILIMILSAANYFPEDTESTSGECYCKCGGGLYKCNYFATRPYVNCPNPVRTQTDIPIPTKTQASTPISTPAKTLIPTPAKTPISNVSPSTLLPTGTRPYYCFVTCKRQVLLKTWFLLILGLI
jgi:hypothetical protein